MNTPAINPTPSQRQLWEAHKARQARLWTSKPRPANANVKTKPVVEVKPIKARQLPMWERGNVHFDAHVVAYRRWQVAVQQLSAFGTSGTFTIDMPPQRKTARQIIEEVLNDYEGITYDDIVGRRRSRRLIEPRHKAIAEVVKQRPDMSLPHIGRIFNRDHTVIIYARDKMSGRPAE